MPQTHVSLNSIARSDEAKYQVTVKYLPGPLSTRFQPEVVTRPVLLAFIQSLNSCVGTGLLVLRFNVTDGLLARTVTGNFLGIPSQLKKKRDMPVIVLEPKGIATLWSKLPDIVFGELTIPLTKPEFSLTIVITSDWDLNVPAFAVDLGYTLIPTPSHC